MSSRLCKGCGGEIPPTRASQARYCGEPCKKRTFRNAHLEQSRKWSREANLKRYYADPDFRARKLVDTQAWRARQPREIRPPNMKDRFWKARALGYRSGLEVAIAEQLKAAGVPFEYETVIIPYVPIKARTYKPDIILPNGIVVELKGRMVSADRSKHKLVKAQHPDLDIRLLFSNPNQKIGKKSVTTYAAWADYTGILWAHKSIPPEWLQEPPNLSSLAALARLKEKKKK